MPRNKLYPTRDLAHPPQILKNYFHPLHPNDPNTGIVAHFSLQNNCSFNTIKSEISWDSQLTLDSLNILLQRAKATGQYRGDVSTKETRQTSRITLAHIKGLKNT